MDANINIALNRNEKELTELALCTYKDNVHYMGFKNGEWQDKYAEKTYNEVSAILTKLQPQVVRTVNLLLYYGEAEDELVYLDYMNGGDVFDKTLISFTETDHKSLSVLSDSMQETQSETHAILLDYYGNRVETLGCWNLPSLEYMFKQAYRTVEVLCWDNNAEAEGILAAWTGELTEEDGVDSEFHSSLVMTIREVDFLEKIREKLSEDGNMKCLVIHSESNKIASVLKSSELISLSRLDLETELKRAVDSAFETEKEFEVEIKQMVEYSQVIKVKANDESHAEKIAYAVACEKEKHFNEDDYERLEVNGSVYDNSATEVQS